MLIDTHILIWMLNNSNLEQVGPQTLEILRTQPLTVSVASLLEIAVKKRKKKLTAPDTNQILNEIISRNATVLDVQPDHILKVPDIESSAHADPFDLLLMAQATAQSIPLITCDVKMLGVVQPGLQLIDGRE